MNANPKTIENAVYNGIRKTINRFREQPFLYFTESDIHASLSRDIMEGNSDILILGKTKAERGTIKTPVSLVHHEYPTNFRYEKSRLKEGYSEDDIPGTHITCKEGDRGNFDLVVLNPDFVRKVFESHLNKGLNEVLGHIINKNIANAISRAGKEELIFAIEVKFIHLFNARNKQMIDEVKGDNEKLRLAIHHEHCLRAINLVFCSSDKKLRRDPLETVIDRVCEEVTSPKEPGIINVFIESHIDAEDEKCTAKPIISASREGWGEFISILKA